MESKTVNKQVELSDYDKRASHFAKVRALIMKIVHSCPGLTISQISEEFFVRYGFLPRIDNRIRELRKMGWVKTIKHEGDGLLHVYPTDVNES